MGLENMSNDDICVDKQYEVSYEFALGEDDIIFSTNTIPPKLSRDNISINP